jgi:hypothetical protein
MQGLTLVSTRQEKLSLMSRHIRQPWKTGTPISSTSIESHAASLRFKDKQNKYKKIIDQAIIRDNQAGNFPSNYKVLPCIFQTSGLIHHEAIGYISDLIELASKDTSVPKENL